MLKIAVLISGGGSNLDSIMDGIDSGYLSNVEIEIVISDREAKGIENAKNRGYKTLIIDRKIYKNTISKEILKTLKDEVDYIILAGFLSVIEDELIQNYPDRIVNIHPSLIPSFSGKGMYGMNVHRAVIKKGVKYTGCTVHFVNEEIDGGAIIKQKVVEVSNDDDEFSIQKKVLRYEHELLPEVIKLLSENKIVVAKNKAFVLN